MDPARIAQLLAPFLPAAALRRIRIEQVALYLDLLLRWNQKVNLTAVRHPEQIIARHFGESFFAAAHLFPDPTATLAAIDLGSGAGFPGLPLKLYAPNLLLTLIESNHKKAAFLKEVVRQLALPEVSVFAGRAESSVLMADLVIMRAVERYQLALNAAVALVRPGGRLALLIGSSQVTATLSLLKEFSWRTPIPVPESTGRLLMIGTNHRS